MKQSIIIQGLALSVLIGVPEEERSIPQTLWVDLEMRPSLSFFDMNDDVGRTIDYAAVAEAIVALGAKHERRLIETLASEIASLVLTQFGAQWVRVIIRKKILPNTDHVAVCLEAHPEELPGFDKKNL